MLSGHVHYVKGKIEQTVGKMLGSEQLLRSGAIDTEAGLAEMKSAHRPSIEQAMPGGLERTLGKALGCEGMVESGEEKLKKGNK